MSSRAYALGLGPVLYSFNPGNPAIGTQINITNTNVVETLVGIDFRPLNGLLYALGVNPLGDTGTLYVISTRTGHAGVVGTFGGVGDLPSGNYGFDFNPAVDRIRVTTDTGLNFRINPNTGAAISPDTPIAGSAITGAAYTNNQPDNGGITTLYTLDSAGDRLMIQNPPNTGIQNLVGFTGVNFSAANGFDIMAGVNAAASNSPVASGSGLALLTVGGVSGVTGLYSIDLVTGAATALGTFLNGATAVRGLAIHSDLGGIPAIALSADGLNIIRFNTATPGTTTPVATSGVTPGETLVGIDFRPNTGQLYAFGVNASADTGTLYRLDPSAGIATVIGVAGGIVAGDLPAGGYGMDFNPAVDRIRITTDSGLNFRINPDTGAFIGPDTTINGLPPGSTGVSAAAYTNSYGQPAGSITTLYTLDQISNSLFIQNPANSGTQTSQLVVRLGGSPLDFTSVSGFDIPAKVIVSTAGAPAIGFGFADLTVGGVTSLYKIDLATGAATNLGAIGTGTTQLAGLALADAPVTPTVPSDFNGDSLGDLLWQTDSGALAIWEMNGFQISFADYTRLGTSAVGLPGPDWHVIDTIDINGDGKADILWRTDSGALAAWEMDGNHIIKADFLKIGSTVINTPGPDWHAIGTLDANGDGKGDILWRTNSGALAIWQLDGNQITFADYLRSGSSLVGVPAPDWHIVGDGDFDGDGKGGLLWRTDGGALATWELDGSQIKSAGFTRLGATTVGAPGSDWHVVDVADFDGDGKSDILWRTGPATPATGVEPGGGSIAIWEMDGNRIKAADYTRAGSTIVGAPGTDWHILGAHDHNGDGQDDLLWRTDGGALAIWEMDGTHVASADYTRIGASAVGVPGPDWHVYEHRYDLV